MQIAVLSDTHDQIANLDAAVAHCNRHGVALIIHCGDLISPFMLKQLAAFQGPVHLVYGNNVGDIHLISLHCVVKYPNITHHGVMGMIEVGGRKIGFHHYPEVAQAMAMQKLYDIVCCGHNHIYAIEQLGATLLVNPGDLLGKNIRPCFCLVDLNTLETCRIEVGKAMYPREEE